MFRRRHSRPDAVEIVAGLWLGACPNEGQALSLFNLGIDHVFDLRAERTHDMPRWPDGVTLTHIAWQDHATPTLEALAAAAQQVSDAWGSGDTCLVHCHAGIERSPTVVMATLLLSGWSMAEAHRAVREARSVIAPTSGQSQVLTALARQRASTPTG